MTIRETLNKISWDPRFNEEEWEITFIHRGAPGNRKIIPFKALKGINPSCFIYLDGGEGETLIPFHRIIKIRNVKTGECVYKKTHSRD